MISVAFIADVDDICVADLAQIVGLAPGGRVERRAIKNQFQTVPVIPDFTSAGALRNTTPAP